MAMEERLKVAKERVMDFFSSLSQRPEEGLIELAGEPHLLVGHRALVAAHKDLTERFGLAAAQLAFYRLGHEMGSCCCKAISEAYGVEEPLDRLLMGPLFFVRVGWLPYVDFLKAELAPGEGWFLLWETRSHFAEKFLELYGKSDQAECFVLAGMSAGWCSEAFGLPLAAREIFCVAKGDGACRFLVAHRARLFELSRQEWVSAPTEGFEITRLELKER